MPSAACVLAAVALLAAQDVDLFRYDRSQPLNLRIDSTESLPEARLERLSYDSPDGGRVPGLLVLPQRPGKHPCIIYLHQLGSANTEFLSEAVGWAGRPQPACALLIAAPFVRREGSRRTFDPSRIDNDRLLQVQAIRDVRRGIDVLATRAEVDARRLAVVGHSYGANWAAILAAVENRLRAFVLIAGLGSVTKAVRRQPETLGVPFTADQLDRYLRSIAPLDPEWYVARAPENALLLQFGRFDSELAMQDMEQFAAVAQKRRGVVRWYAADHQMLDASSIADRYEFLSNRLGLGR